MESLTRQTCSQENHGRQRHHEKQLTKKIWFSKSLLAQIGICHMALIWPNVAVIIVLMPSY